LSAALRGRYAPSPTGELHVGNASTALLAWLSVRAGQGRWIMRIEDLDRGRSRDALIQPILDDLRWLGLDWDEGGEIGGEYAPYRQSERIESHRQAFERLHEMSALYPCFCSRKDIAAAASAPQLPGEELRYPGSCRRLDPEVVERRLAAGERHAWRYRVPDDSPTAFEDRVHGHWSSGEEGVGDFVVWRSDGVPSYQLAVVVDDARMRINEVVRGDDLLSSTLRQCLLFRALDLPLPRFGHVPLLCGPDGQRLSKRHDGTTLRELRERGLEGRAVVGQLAHAVGLRQTPTALEPSELVSGFSLEDVPRLPGGVIVDPSGWR
jgi:glutamyl-tRNA synthetase